MTVQSRRIRRDLVAVLENVLAAIDPFSLTKNNLTLQGNRLTVAKELKLDLSRYKNIYVLGAGKAVYKMALAVERLLGARINAGWINIPAMPEKNELTRIKVHLARHPRPNAAGMYGSKTIRSILKGAGEDDLVIAVISGGGSALMPLPADGITLSEKIQLTSLFLKSAASIHEINVVRKHMSGIKGGQFARYAYPATLVALYVSDIIDDSFDIQASGPTAPDPSTFSDAIEILKKFGIWNSAPHSIRTRFLLGAKGSIPETPKPQDDVFRKGKVHNFTIANHNTACEASAEAGKQLGYHVLPLTSSIQGEAREVAKVIIAIGKQVLRYGKPLTKPALIIAGGETPVNVRGKGMGGRMQEFGLAALLPMKDGMTLVSFATDGVDGMTPEPTAGAFCDMGTKLRGQKMGLDVHTYLTDNNSYAYFHQVGDHIITGPTGTNVADLTLLAVY
jgi:glycerate 2-kinase